MPFKDIYWDLWWPLCSADWNNLIYCSRRHHEEQFCEIILNLDQWPFKGISYLELWQPFCSAEQNHLCNFGRRYYEEKFCKLFWIWAIGSRVECIFKDFLSGALVALLFGGTKPFILFWNRASWGTFMWSYIKFEPVVQEGMSFKQKVYGPRAKADHKGSPFAFSPGELRKMQKFWEVQNSGVIYSSTNL